MIRSFAKLSALAVAGFVLLAAPQSARATLILESTQADFDFGGGVHSVLFVDENAFGAPGSVITFLGRSVLLGADQNLGVVGSLVLSSSVGGVAQPIQVGNFSVTGSASQSNSPGLPGAVTTETLTSTSLNVVNTSGETHSQQVVVSDNNFAALLNGQMTSTAGGDIHDSTGQTSTTAGSVAVTTVDNGANALGGGTSINPGVSPLLFGFNGTVFTGLFAAADGPRAIPFVATMGKSIEFDLTLTSGASLNGRTNQVTNTGVPVPEPATVVMALGAVPFLGVGAWRRLRRNRKSS